MTDVAEHPLQELYRDEYRSLVRLASLLIDDVGTCEEVVQDAFANALSRWSTVRDPAKAPAFIRSAVLNGARSRLRRRVVALRHPQLPPPDVASAEGATVDHDEVIRRLRALPQRQMEALVLRYYLDLPEAEIATTMGVSVGSVKTHLHRGLAALALTLGPSGVDESEDER
jgi:RNA polymerase sigma-70 factor (sigma-E family)